MDKVAIGIPAYRNPEALHWVLDSLLRQSHDNIQIFVFDNCLAESFEDVRSVIGKVDDERIEYSANHTNIGYVENYKKCFEAVSKYSYGMVVSADIGLLPDALEIMLGEIRKPGADIVYPKVLLVNEPSAAWHVTSKSQLISTKNPEYNIETLSSSAVIGEFFSGLNLGGEYNRFSFLGALAKGHLFRRLSALDSTYRFHGWEFQNSILLASQAKSIALFHNHLLVSITGLEKSPQTARPETDWTRLEPILATYETVKAIAREGAGQSSELNSQEVLTGHLDLLEHYSSKYGRHKVVAWVTRVVVTFGISNPLALRRLFGLLVRFRSKRANIRGTPRDNKKQLMDP